MVSERIIIVMVVKVQVGGSSIAGDEELNAYKVLTISNLGLLLAKGLLLGRISIIHFSELSYASTLFSYNTNSCES